MWTPNNNSFFGGSFFFPELCSLKFMLCQKQQTIAVPPRSIYRLWPLTHAGFLSKGGAKVKCVICVSVWGIVGCGWCVLCVVSERECQNNKPEFHIVGDTFGALAEQTRESAQKLAQRTQPLAWGFSINASRWNWGKFLVLRAKKHSAKL